jgi:hypothetical protein
MFEACHIKISSLYIHTPKGGKEGIVFFKNFTYMKKAGFRV